MRINEVFYSIQGEGIWQGIPTIFVRLQGCDQTCKWCDTLYARDPSGGKEATIAEITTQVENASKAADWVCITGGEPLRQEEMLYPLVQALDKIGFMVEIETNGLYHPPWWKDNIESWSADFKCPSAGLPGESKEAWLYLKPTDQVKFVVQDERDLTFVEDVLLSNKDYTSTILISPVINLINSPHGEKDYIVPAKWMQRCVEFVKEYNLHLSLQIHKFIWEPNVRGV